jgi:hypothetical protein
MSTATRVPETHDLEALTMSWVRQFYRDLFADTGGVPVPGEGSSGALINHLTSTSPIRSGIPPASLGTPCTTRTTTPDSSRSRRGGTPATCSTTPCPYAPRQHRQYSPLTRQTRGDGGVQQPALPLRPALDRGHYPRFPGSARGRCPRCLASATQR